MPWPTSSNAGGQSWLSSPGAEGRTCTLEDTTVLGPLRCGSWFGQMSCPLPCAELFPKGAAITKAAVNITLLREARGCPALPHRYVNPSAEKVSNCLMLPLILKPTSCDHGGRSEEQEECPTTPHTWPTGPGHPISDVMAKFLLTVTLKYVHRGQRWEVTECHQQGIPMPTSILHLCSPFSHFNETS